MSPETLKEEQPETVAESASEETFPLPETTKYTREQMDQNLRQRSQVEVPLKPTTAEQLCENITEHCPYARPEELNIKGIAAIHLEKGNEKYLPDLEAHLRTLGFLPISEDEEGPGTIYGSSGHVPMTRGRYNPDRAGNGEYVVRVNLF